ncbi:MAG TPA: hydantoinase B/oxoprolinase family protein [Chloroflexota bacterium]|nr:hydantoinase B/oxoprolinase family protein [Chloroflexota bacterium]
MSQTATTPRIDPITLEVVRNRLAVIADEMEEILLRSSYSPIVKEGLDASAALFTIGGETLAQSVAIPIHLGTLVPAVRRIIAEFPLDQMHPDDAYAMNDPYDGGTHLPDVIMVVPIFAGNRVVALSTTLTHHQEMGGKTAGSVPTDATEIFQEGIIIPPLKFIDRGAPNETLHRLWARNLRIPDVVFGDLRAQVAACRAGGRRVQALVSDLGVDSSLSLFDALLNNAERLTRARIAEIPDGTYTFTDYLDNDGVELDRRLQITATVTIAGDRFKVDFTGTSSQARGPVNAVPSSTLSAVYYCVKAVTDPEIPNNVGCYRAIDVVLPVGSLVNPIRPAPVNARTATVKRITDAIFGALHQALPGRLPAAPSGELLVMSISGIDPRTGQRFITSELGTGGMGARPGKDGIDVIETDATNCMNLPAESIEVDFPIRINHWRLRTDSGGAGQWRGGLGFVKSFEAIGTELELSYRGERHSTAPWGVEGGHDGDNGRARIWRADGQVETVNSKQIVHLQPGERLEVELAGGAGYGDPLKRDRDRIRDDLKDRKISTEAARELYGFEG